MSIKTEIDSATEAVAAPPVVTAMVVHQPGAWFGEVLAGLANQDYRNLGHIFFLTTPVIEGVADTSVANALSGQITDSLPNAVVRIVEGNPGFGRLINEIQRIVEGQDGLFCILHDDVALTPSTIRLLVEELFISNAAVVGPKLLQWDSPQILQSVGFGIDRCAEVDSFIEQNERDQGQHDSVRDVFYVSSACMLVRSDLFRELNGFNSDISFFGEDLEFCWRAHLSGARVLVTPTASARHQKNFESRSPEIVSRGLIAQHRARTVATLTSRLRLPFVWLQMLLISAVETVLGIFSGSFRESLASLRATLGLVIDGAYIWRRRRLVRPLRRVVSGQISKLQLRGSARLTRFVRHRRAMASLEIASLVKTKKRWKQSSTRTAGMSLLVFAILIIFGSRQIITNSTQAIGEMLPFDDGSSTPISIFTNFLSGWWASGFGEASANPTGMGLVALGALLVFGNLALLQTLMIVGSIFIGLIGMWRLCGVFGNTRVRLVGAVVYAGLPLSFDAIARGRFSALLCIAAIPWLLDLLNRYEQAQSAESGNLARRTQIISGLILILGLTFAFTSSIAVVSVIAIALWSLASVMGGVSPKSLLLTAVVGLLGVVGAVFINLPWSLHFVSSDWWALLAGDQGATNRRIGLASLARLDMGNMLGGFLVLTIYFCVVCALVIANSWRRLWAIRSGVLVVFSVLVILLDDFGLLPFEIAEPSVMLALVACGLSLSVATCLSVFAESNIRRESDWRRSLSLLVLASIAMSVMPSLLSVTDGRWNQPENTVAQLLVQLPDNPIEGNYRTLFIGDRNLLPISTNYVNSDLSYGVADDGPLNFASIWAPQETPMNESTRQALELLVANDTSRVGQLVSPLALRYLVVPLGSEPTSASKRLVESLSNQLDLRRLYFSRDLVIFENVSWLPMISVLDKESSIASEQVNDLSLISQKLKSDNALLVDKNPVSNKKVKTRFSGGTVHLSVPFDAGWHLTIDGAQLSPRVAFGASTAFDVPIAGVAQLEYKTSILRYLYLILQAIVWLALIILAVNISRFRGRIQKISEQRIKIIGEATQNLVISEIISE